MLAMIRRMHRTLPRTNVLSLRYEEERVIQALGLAPCEGVHVIDSPYTLNLII